jgi:predicted membrane metal-binding protein
MVISLAVQMWLQLLLAFNFNRLSWVAPVANIILVPVSSLVLLAGTAAAAVTK